MVWPTYLFYVIDHLILAGISVIGIVVSPNKNVTANGKKMVGFWFFVGFFLNGVLYFQRVLLANVVKNAGSVVRRGAESTKNTING
jgi:hypothetical protein